MSLALLATHSLCDRSCVVFNANCRAPHSMYRRRRLTRSCVYQPLGWPTFEEHISAHNSRFGTPKSEQLNQVWCWSRSPSCFKQTTDQYTYGLINQRCVGACIACGPICGSHDSPQRHFLRRGSQHSFHPIFHSSKWPWSRRSFIYFFDIHACWQYFIAQRAVGE